MELKRVGANCYSLIGDVIPKVFDFTNEVDFKESVLVILQGSKKVCQRMQSDVLGLIFSLFLSVPLHELLKKSYFTSLTFVQFVSNYCLT